MKYFYCFSLLVAYLSAYSQCEEYEKQNSQLISEKSELQKKLDTELIAYDKLHLKYRQEVEERKKFEQLYYREKTEKERLQRELNLLNEKYNSIRAERDRLSRKIKELKNADLSTNKEYTDAIIARDNLNNELTKMEGDKDEFKTRFIQREEAVRELELTIKQLEDEAKDRISVSQKKVFFNAKEYAYGDEIIFIRFEEGSTNKMTIKKEDEYYLNRISKLASKYDYRVKVTLIGESANSSDSERKKLAEGRLDKVKSTMIVTYDLQAADFGKSSIVREKARIGVSVRIENK